MKNTKHFLVVFYLIAVTGFAFHNVQAQKEANTWYFGNGAGLDFNYETPRVLGEGKIYTNEGSAVISDKNGNLLFYTDGINVWNRDHEVMENGTGLHGDASSTQSALIVPKPGRETLFYIFTVAEKAGAEGLSYSIVDMGSGQESADQFKNNKHYLAPDIKIVMGKGKVIEKNHLLFTPASEKLTAVKHSNGSDYWIISHKWNSNSFVAYPLNPQGIGEAVISNAGLFHGDASNKTIKEAIGYLKSSADGKKICLAICYKLQNNIEVFDFDNTNGTISNPLQIPSASGGFAYGISFSPDNTKLYVSFLNGNSGIIQYKMPIRNDETGQKNLIESAVEITENEEEYSFGSLQLGPDGKLYAARIGSYIDVIHTPNAEGKNCNYQRSAIHLGPGNSTYGLPNNISVSTEIFIGNDTAACIGPLKLYAPLYQEATYRWSNGETTPSITVSQSGKYQVQIYNKTTQNLNVGIINVKIDTPPVVNLGNDTSNCERELILNAGNRGASYLWSTGENTQTIIARKTGEYWVEVSKGSCKKSDTINLILAGSTTVFTPLENEVSDKGFINTTFYYSPYDLTDYNLKIFTQRGKLKFESDDINKNWNLTYREKEVKKGDYKWIVTYKSKCMSNKEFVKEGILTIIDKMPGIGGG